MCNEMNHATCITEITPFAAYQHRKFINVNAEQFLTRIEYHVFGSCSFDVDNLAGISHFGLI